MVGDKSVIADNIKQDAQTDMTVSVGKTPAQNLTLSIVWALYALVLLGVGMARTSVGRSAIKTNRSTAKTVMVSASVSLHR